MSQKAILIGAGQIGRGVIGQVLSHAGYELVFVDTAASLVEQINCFKKYKVITLGADESEFIVDELRAYLPSDPRAVDEMAEADILTTAVGPQVLAKTAPYIAAGISRRNELGSKRSLTVIACENMEFGSSRLEKAVKSLLNEKDLAYCEQYTGFPDAEVSRMVMPIKDENPLTVKVEQYMEWIVDKNKVQGDLGGISGLKLSDNAGAYIKRKMYTLTGHAMLGYLGYNKGYQYIYQAAYDEIIFGVVFKALVECGKGWSAEYRQPIEDFYEYITVMLRRFSDTRMKDPCVRICREPIRKLSDNERFIAPAGMAIRHGIKPENIVRGIQSVLRYDYSEEPQAFELQNMLKKEGLAAVLEKICGLDQGEELFKMIQAG
jgi:mannitol-1-phosphate 5-dehydrogenase